MNIIIGVVIILVVAMIALLSVGLVIKSKAKKVCDSHNLELKEVTKNFNKGIIPKFKDKNEYVKLINYTSFLDSYFFIGLIIVFAFIFSFAMEFNNIQTNNMSAMLDTLGTSVCEADNLEYRLTQYNTCESGPCSGIISCIDSNNNIINKLVPYTVTE